MDEMSIVSKFTTNLISKIVTKLARKELGCNIDIHLSKVNVYVTDEKAHIYLDAEAEIRKEDLIKLIKNANLI